MTHFGKHLMKQVHSKTQHSIVEWKWRNPLKYKLFSWLEKLILSRYKLTKNDRHSEYNFTQNYRSNNFGENFKFCNIKGTKMAKKFEKNKKHKNKIDFKSYYKAAEFKILY